MILIDLLPDEYRQTRRTPLKFMAALMVTVAVKSDADRSTKRSA